MIDPHIESLIRDLFAEDVRDYEEFKPFVEFYENCEHNARLLDYCNHAKKDYNEYLKRMLTVISHEMGWNEVYVPFCIHPWDITEKTEIYLLWKKCFNDYINNKLKQL
jgi:hypothetical protein